MMSPSSLQTQALFDKFMSLPDNNFLSAPYEDLLAKKRHSREFCEVQHIAYDSVLQRDSGKTLQLGSHGSPVRTRSPAQFQSINEVQNQQLRKEESSVEGKRRPTEEEIKDAAMEIARVGDKIQNEYNFKKIEGNLLALFRDASADLTYEVFAAHVNDLIGSDRNLENFKVVMHLSKRVVVETKNLGSRTISFFRRFVTDAFAEEINNQNGVIPFVYSNEIDQ